MKPVMMKGMHNYDQLHITRRHNGEHTLQDDLHSYYLVVRALHLQSVTTR